MSEPIFTQADLDELKTIVASKSIQSCRVGGRKEHICARGRKGCCVAHYVIIDIETTGALLNIIAKQREALKDIDGIEHAHLCDCVACSEIGEVASAALALVKE